MSVIARATTIATLLPSVKACDAAERMSVEYCGYCCATSEALVNELVSSSATWLVIFEVSSEGADEIEPSMWLA